jgi:hypothetical protein
LRYYCIIGATEDLLRKNEEKNLQLNLGGRGVFGCDRRIVQVPASSVSINPRSNEQLPGVHINFFGPGLDPVLANLQENN